jgi:hypothetical protein
LGKGVTRTNALESLVIAGFVRGLSVRDMEAALAEALGPEATVSKSTVSRVCQAIRDEFDGFRHRDLSGVELEYLFLDGSHFKYHAGAKAEPVLVAWGITTTGKPVLLHLAPGSSESTDAWAGFLDDMAARGLRPPLLVISDGAPGLIAAGELKLTTSLRQRCLIHRSRHDHSSVCGNARCNPDAVQVEVRLNTAMPTAKKSSTSRKMSAEHKAALAKGREEGLAVRRYLEALESARPRRGRRRSSSSIEARLTAMDEQLNDADPLTRLHLLQQQKDLQEELSRVGKVPDITNLEQGFIDAAKSCGERKGISYGTWRSAGVSAAVLQKAGIARARS